MANSIRILVYGIAPADSAGNYGFIGNATEKVVPTAGIEVLPVDTPKQFPGLVNIIYGKVIYWPGGNPTAAKEAYVMDSVLQLAAKINA